MQEVLLRLGLIVRGRRSSCRSLGDVRLLCGCIFELVFYFFSASVPVSF